MDIHDKITGYMEKKNYILSLNHVYKISVAHETETSKIVREVVSSNVTSPYDKNIYCDKINLLKSDLS